MSVSYDKLWKILDSREITKIQMRKEAKIASSSLIKMTRGQEVNETVLDKICAYLGTDRDELIDIIPDAEAEKKPKYNDTWCGFRLKG